ncbi:MAG: WXG100 family type VII secretion target [Cellulomonas sp.]|jgi:WXG100 family type VII secretion target|nr:WXG100 family type VII secretion target [Cellulomonas sp.]
MTISVSYEELDAAAAKLTSGQEEINTKLNELKTYITGLVGSGFVTEKASTAFNESYTQFTTGATTAIAGLTGMATYLTNAKTALQETDTALAGAAGS